ncbi:NUDIX domain-containing protein [Paractinoplanes ovalisporus]|uniref:NUDIX domain-containing protein n=1 Tax=Paractinoplanes ovalisporus TaxID=2810368 RepID=UPI0027DCB434|nr:NUDIX domain-containing protein [Actinoplanes ovalisporus]
MADAAGNELLEFTAGTEADVTRRDDGIPLPLALVVARHHGLTLLVLNRARRQWELPGGMLDPGETPRQAALREFAEETGQPEPSLLYAGRAKFRLMPDRRLEYAAVYTATQPVRTPFVPTDEIACLLWWDGTPLPDMAALDAEICVRVSARI